MIIRRLRSASIRSVLMIALVAALLASSMAFAQSVPIPGAASAPAGVALTGGPRKTLFGAQFDPRNPQALPAAINPDWASLIGEYGPEMTRFYILEDAGELKLLSGWFDLEILHPQSSNVFTLSASGPHGAQTVTVLRDPSNAVTAVEIAGIVYKRRPFDAPGEFFHITPIKPVDELRKVALAATQPAEQGKFRKPDLVELNKLDPTIKLDIRYATSRNFLGSPLYLQPRAYMQRPAAEAVARASQHLHSLGYGLIIHDSYRPWYVTKMFWDGTPPNLHGFVANPAKGSKHNRGCAIDLSLYDLKSGEEIRMTGGYDEMSDRSHPYYPGGTSYQRWHRDLLRTTMESEGFTVDPGEWWHFDYKDWPQYPILNLTFEQLESAAQK
jgi:D-alanyl-D-alanine dipeptidase